MITQRRKVRLDFLATAARRYSCSVVSRSLVFFGFGFMTLIAAASRLVLMCEAYLIFPRSHREMLNTILDEEGLKTDREGQPRTAYSLRHTYICLRLMEGADIYQIAKNCRTSVEMIEKFGRVCAEGIAGSRAPSPPRSGSSTRNGRGRLFRRSKGRTAPGMLLQ
jgi:hypothetical protein